MMEAVLAAERRGTIRHFPGVQPRTQGPAGSNVVLGMLIFVACEGMLFAGLISSYIVLRAGLTMWPPADQPRFPLAVTALNTLVLLASGWSMTQARGAIRTGRAAALTSWLGRTVLLGVLFLTIQGIEWVRLIGHGLSVTGGVYGGLFAALIGAHGAHVVGGLVAVALAWNQARRRRYSIRSHDTITGVQIYWLFVVGVWPVLYWLVYIY